MRASRAVLLGLVWLFLHAATSPKIMSSNGISPDKQSHIALRGGGQICHTGDAGCQPFGYTCATYEESCVGWFEEQALLGNWYYCFFWPFGGNCALSMPETECVRGAARRLNYDEPPQCVPDQSDIFTVATGSDECTDGPPPGGA